MLKKLFLNQESVVLKLFFSVKRGKASGMCEQKASFFQFTFSWTDHQHQEQQIWSQIQGDDNYSFVIDTHIHTHIWNTEYNGLRWW